MENPNNLNKTEAKPGRTVEELEAMIEIIDSEIVSLGEKISPEKLKFLTEKKGVMAKEIARLKGEPLTDGTIDNFFR